MREGEREKLSRTQEKTNTEAQRTRRYTEKSFRYGKGKSVEQKPKSCDGIIVFDLAFVFAFLPKE